MKIILGFLIFLYISVSTHLVELVKIPMLYSHYLEHKEENKNLTFSDFISLHYSNDSGHSGNKHASLPFKTSKEISSISSVLKFESYTLEINTFFDFIFNPIVISYKSKYSFQFLNAIWQPPRI